ncbi:helix-turn-helix domain-containing protein [Yinghuangia soli]|uniref:Helix-turn-helix domain-containing protein n=1 Tax=Yinghuangia soli TaxID=2908204 RepID=A0AA41U5L8_9ACTN|nr:helix-turn-helix transcriptional regulator [Yinghuangia soli]MCF2532067.1 helix-turn-helix domain-containing protein [Yinghuangia soli]
MPQTVTGGARAPPGRRLWDLRAVRVGVDFVRVEYAARTNEFDVSQREHAITCLAWAWLEVAGGGCCGGNGHQASAGTVSHMGTTTGGSGRNKGRMQPDDRPAIWVGYGKLLKLFRERAGLTQQALADAVGYSVEHVASIEQGRRPAKESFTEAVEELLGAEGALAVLQNEVDLAKLPQFFQDVAMIEADAATRYSYDTQLVPGLLQTEEYARALFEARCPPLPDEQAEQLLEARMRRQALLGRVPTTEFSFVVCEAALRCPVGGPVIMRAQLHHLVRCSELRNVELQVMPLGYGPHAGIHGPMLLVETVEHRHVAYFESNGEGHLIADPRKVSLFAMRYGKLRSQALGGEASVRLIERIAGEL